MVSNTEIQAEATGADDEIRMILLSTTGTGKSSVGNTILSRKLFEAKMAPVRVTTKCASGARIFENKRQFIVDTLGFLDYSIKEADIQQEVAKSYQLTAVPGPHVYLLMVEPGRMLAIVHETTDYFRKIFGPKAIDHTIVIFTHGDELEEEETTLDDYLLQFKSDSPIRKLLQQCDQRYLSFNNKGKDAQKNEAVRNLLKRIEDMMSKNPDKVYIKDVFEAVAK
ncbi:unnamed protein product [Rotaria sp. Silwood1]|nr:unnamed protein product [Rotaria sp. Silwood1]CAF3871626.1 unnamed protein product [Rotaria sp. Silwood1]CAF3936650.1 unnamed protein product [Rotaria sp. Silwood1]CAF4944905.1 unnamed protein product [Rotaria sp. Silwood1]CAF4995661.1 unnamed protein product [Rotaria sp. Silwood1]